MFFSNEILSKKHSIGVIWLAATLKDKKLSKKEYLQVDIVDACDFIADPPQPLALRLSSNLMFGVLRVYRQQCIFHYNDVNQVFLRLKRYCVTETELTAVVETLAEKITLASSSSTFNIANLVNVANLPALNVGGIDGQVAVANGFDQTETQENQQQLNAFGWIVGPSQSSERHYYSSAAASSSLNNDGGGSFQSNANIGSSHLMDDIGDVNLLIPDAVNVPITANAGRFSADSDLIESGPGMFSFDLPFQDQVSAAHFDSAGGTNSISGLESYDESGGRLEFGEFQKLKSRKAHDLPSDQSLSNGDDYQQPFNYFSPPHIPFGENQPGSVGNDLDRAENSFNGQDDEVQTEKQHKKKKNGHSNKRAAKIQHDQITALPIQDLLYSRDQMREMIIDSNHRSGRRAQEMNLFDRLKQNFCHPKIAADWCNQDIIRQRAPGNRRRKSANGKQQDEMLYESLATEKPLHLPIADHPEDMFDFGGHGPSGGYEDHSVEVGRNASAETSASSRELVPWANYSESVMSKQSSHLGSGGIDARLDGESRRASSNHSDSVNRLSLFRNSLGSDGDMNGLDNFLPDYDDGASGSAAGPRLPNMNLSSLLASRADQEYSTGPMERETLDFELFLHGLTVQTGMNPLEFDDIMRLSNSHSKQIAARLLYNVLTLATAGKLEVEQEEPFSSISIYVN